MRAELQLAREYGVSLGTVRRATAVLRERGLVVTLRRKCTFFSARPKAGGPKDEATSDQSTTASAPRPTSGRTSAARQGSLPASTGARPPRSERRTARRIR
jgi:DNA-binding GntR family transcriptional regulator